jgi:hypothetical protein
MATIKNKIKYNTPPHTHTQNVKCWQEQRKGDPLSTVDTVAAPKELGKEDFEEIIQPMFIAALTT